MSANALVDVMRRELNELVRREFVRPVRVSSIDGEDEFSFWHVLVRDVAYQQIPRSPRAEKHVAAARWVEQRPRSASPTTRRSSFTTTARRWASSRSAGDARPEIESGLTRNLVLAGDRAWQLDTLAAEAHYRRALELSTDEPAHATVLSKLANVLAQRGEMELAVDAFHAAIPVLRDEDPVGAGIAIKDLARATWGQGDVDVARGLGYEAISILEHHPGPELVDAYGSAAQRAAIGGRFEEATGYVEKGLALASELGVANVMALLMARVHRPWVLRRPPVCQRLPGGPRSRLSPRSRKNDGRRDEQLRGRALLLRLCSNCAGCVGGSDRILT